LKYTYKATKFAVSHVCFSDPTGNKSSLYEL
jgi:hypothetical protein